MLANLNLEYTLLAAGLIHLLPLSVSAQIAIDGSTATTLTRDGDRITIDDGDRAEGNLFHSFRDFSVPNGGEAFFNNAADVTNIFSRVTGGNISNIDGLIRANNTNLFLINPAGIVFGEGARLNIGGSFYGSTADRILFDEGEFSATDLDNPPLLTVNAPIGLNFRDNPADIAVQSSNLTVQPGQNLTLIGGNLNLTDSVRIFSPGANVELAAVSGNGVIGLDDNLSLNFPDNIALADLSFDGDVAVNVSSDNGGSITINANNVELLDNSRLVAGIAANAGTADSQAGDIVINARETLTLDSSSIFSNVGGIGNAGNIIINALNSISLEDGNIQSQVIQGGNGSAGNIDVTTGSLSIISLTERSERLISRLNTNSRGIGNAGNITIKAADIFLDRGGISSQIQSEGQGNGGTIRIDTNSATIINRSEVLLGTSGQGNAGNLIFNARDNILVDGNSLIISQVIPGGGTAGDIDITAGNIDISTNLLSLANFSLISTNTQAGGLGESGNLNVTANTIRIQNGAILDSLTENSFDGGNITINAETLELARGGKIVTGTDDPNNNGNAGNAGNAGNIILNITEKIDLNGSNPAIRPPEIVPFEEQLLNDLESSTGLFASATERSSGDGGSILISNPKQFSISDRAQVSVASEGQGNGGNLSIQANSLDLKRGGAIAASTNFQTGGVITLNVQDNLTLSDESLITARAFNDADGGNIDVTADFVVAFPSKPNGSDIIASAQGGDGGNINITAQEIFGLGERVANPGNGTNDIDVSSEFGLDGNVSIQTPDTHSIKNVAELSTNVVEQNNSFAQVCDVDANAETSRFVIKGRGGIPPQPTAIFTADSILNDEESTGIESRNNELKKALETQYPPIATDRGDIYPARGVIIQEDGTVTLTTYPVDNQRQRTLVASGNCTPSY